MTIYLDTSAVLRALLADGNPLGVWGKWDRAYSSELMGVEARRAIDRLRLERALDDEGAADAHQALAAAERAIGAIRLTAEVLRRAGQPMPTVVKTLDAIHLASALLFAQHTETGLVFGTHDRGQAIAARALGFVVVGASKRV
ncbi:MAG: PIN domain-containing protein [Bryobacterales bacterium]|nr:PIN domain-containing protein [Bryobacterales bacterium]